jgi:hypothetical protein
MNSTSLAFNENPKVDRRIGFWNGTSRYGVIHHLSPEGEPAAHSTLVVFVHGLFGDCRRTWGEMPEWVLDNAGVDLDVISFDYPAQLWERSSIEQAAYDLKTWLSTEFSGHRHLIFMTHSAGGLIVKHLLREEFRGIQHACHAGDFDYASSGALWLRTRHIVNIAVPHQGGAPLLTRLSHFMVIRVYLFCDWYALPPREEATGGETRSSTGSGGSIRGCSGSTGSSPSSSRRLTPKDSQDPSSMTSPPHPISPFPSRSLWGKPRSFSAVPMAR